MADGIDIKIEGLEEVKRMLGQLPDKIAKQVLRKATLSGAALLRNAIRKVAPVRTAGGKPMKMSRRAGTRSPGFLQKNISAWFMRGKSGAQVIHYGVMPRGQAYYGYIVEKGHAAGAKKAIAEHSYLRRKGRSISHLIPKLTFVSPHPFIIPTFEAMTEKIIDRMKKRALSGSIAEGKKLGFKIGV